MKKRQILKREILERSRATTWEGARAEWRLIAIHHLEDGEDGRSCICSHKPIRELCMLHNFVTKESVIVGNVCVKLFLGVRSDLIFAAIKRITDDITRSVNRPTLVLAYRSGWITAKQGRFYTETMRQRDLTSYVERFRTDINRKILVGLDSISFARPEGPSGPNPQ